MASTQAEVREARGRLSQAQSELDAYWGNGGLRRWLQDALFISRGPVFVFNDAVREAERNLAAARAGHAEAERRLQESEGPLRAAFGTADPSELTRHRDDLQTRIREASITPGQLQEVRSAESSLSEGLDRLQGAHEDRTPTPAPAPPPVSTADVEVSQTRIETLARDIEFYEALLQDTRVLMNPGFGIFGEGRFTIDRTEARDELILDMRAGVITPEQALAQAQVIAAYDRHVRTQLREHLDSLRGRQEALQAEHDVLVTRTRQERGAAAAWTLTVASTRGGCGGMEISADPTAYGGTLLTSFWHRGIPDDTTITLTAPSTHPATPAPWVITFIEWTGCDSASAATCTVHMTSNRGVTADCAKGCYSETKAWDVLCFGRTEVGAHDEIVTVQNTMPGMAGSATYRCDRGRWVRLSATCTRTD